MMIRLKNRSGIYIIINKITKNTYVGSAINNQIFNRYVSHMLRLNGSKLVRKAILKHGLNNFIFGILKYSSEKIDRNNQNKLFDIENEYLSLLLPKYNILLEAGNTKDKLRTEEAIKRVRSLFSKERRLLLKNLQHSRKGNWSENSKNKLRDIALNRPDNYLTDKGRNKLSENSSKIIQLFDLDNNYLCEFKNINTTSHYLCCSYKTIQRSLLLGWIYIPYVFHNYLNNTHLSKYNDIISFINPHNDVFYLNARNQRRKIKSGLINLDWNNKYIIKYKN